MYPILFQSESVTLYSYPLIIAFASVVGLSFFLESSNAQRQQSKNLKTKTLAAIAILCFSWLGAKLFFLFVLAINEFSMTPSDLMVSSRFWLGGGFVFYGGFLSGGLLTWICYVLRVFDSRDLFIMARALFLGHGIGRIGCVLAGCCHGEIVPGLGSYQVPILESLFLFSFFFFSKRLQKQSFWTLILSYALFRFGIEFFRQDSIRGGLGGLSTSQAVSIGIILLYSLRVFIKTKRFETSEGL